MKVSIHVNIELLTDKYGHEITHTPTIERLVAEWINDQADVVIEIVDGNMDVVANLVIKGDATVMRKD